MQIRQRIKAAHTKLAACRWTAWLLCAAMIGGMVGPALSAIADEPEAPDNAQKERLIAHFTFDDESDRLQDSSGNVTADLYTVDGQQVIDRSAWNDYFDEQNALHLSDDAYLALPEGFLNGLTEMTVEMRIKIEERSQYPQGHNENWLFYAGSNNPNNYDANRRCLGIALINNNASIKVQRYNGGGDKDGAVESGYSFVAGTWYTVRVVYKVSSTALYIDEARVAENSTPNRLSDYFGENSVIWFGHSAWDGNAGFNGYIDDIKIYNYANYDGRDIGPINEDDYIIKDFVDPEDAIVNMFDYWITEQTENDYNPPLTADAVRNGGINKDHLFLFAGSDGADNAYANLNRSEDVGSWNNFYEGAYHQQYEPYSGIVRNVLSHGYPQLAIDQLLEDGRCTLASVWNASDVARQTESLAYLFDPDVETPGRKVYPNVTGLFRLNDEGYYYFRSNEAYAELNAEQSTGAKTSTTNNHITLYNEIWNSNFREDGKEPLGQFFPFNDWSDLFYINEAGELVQAYNMAGQSTTDEPLNHYFGMTVETKFQQPVDGLLNNGSNEQPMTFEFSGDDDVWIFIDDVLVGDLGGLHQRVRITIDFATGIIDYTGQLDSSGRYGTQDLEGFDSTLRKMFARAGREGTTDWNGDTFADGSTHTLKFFYLERGNATSNCSISFNMYKAENDPSPEPSEEPSPEPSEEPSPEPSEEPSPEPSEEPSPEPSEEPSPKPSEEPSPKPSEDPSPKPSEEPSPEPSEEPSPKPSEEPSPEPSGEPSPAPSEEPAPEPTPKPTQQPPQENKPTNNPTEPPKEEKSVNASTGQPPQDDDVIGASRAPKTADSSMVGLWLTLSAFSLAGIILTTVYYTRKRGNK